MTIESGKVATGDTIRASDFNKLRNDLLANHTHASGEGGTVDHADLVETGDMSAMSHRHDDIEVHLLGGGPGANSIDDPGGNRGVHGLDDSVYVAGSEGYKQSGSYYAGQLVVTGGYQGWTGSGSDRSKSFTFGTSSFNVVYVTVTPYVASPSAGNYYILVLSSVSGSGFTLYAPEAHPTGLYWTAVGVLA